MFYFKDRIQPILGEYLTCCLGFSAHNSLVHTLFLKHVYVPDDGPEEGSLLGVIVHAVGHQFSQLSAAWSGQLALGFIKPLLLLSTKTNA